jgi:arginase
VLEWIAGTGAQQLAVHIDLDVIDRRDFTGSVGQNTDGMRMSDVVSLVNDAAAAADIVGLSLTEHIPTELMRLGGLLRDLPV